jgi:hypothetical protein
MATNTKQPEVLRELFEVLGSDPFVIAECLARPIVAERLVTNGDAHVRFNAELKQSRLGNAELRRPNYTLPVIAGPLGGCTEDTWTPTSLSNAPSPRVAPAVWTGSEMIVWGGTNGGFLNTEGRYDPGTDSWTATSIANAPTSRQQFTAVWTGTEMIVWGGYNGTNLNSGGQIQSNRG